MLPERSTTYTKRVPLPCEPRKTGAGAPPAPMPGEPAPGRVGESVRLITSLTSARAVGGGVVAVEEGVGGALLGAPETPAVVSAVFFAAGFVSSDFPVPDFPVSVPFSPVALVPGPFPSPAPSPLPAPAGWPLPSPFPALVPATCGNTVGGVSPGDGDGDDFRSHSRRAQRISKTNEHSAESKMARPLPRGFCGLS